MIARAHVSAGMGLLRVTEAIAFDLDIFPICASGSWQAVPGGGSQLRLLESGTPGQPEEARNGLHVNVDAVRGVTGFERLPEYRGAFSE